MLAVNPAERASTTDILSSPAGKQLVDTYLGDVAANTEIDEATKAEICQVVREQMGSLGSMPPDTDDLDQPSPRRSPRSSVVFEGAVKIGCSSSWRPRYVLVDVNEITVKRERSDTRCERIPLSSVAKVHPYTGGEQSAEHVTIVTLKNKFSVWIKAESDEERDKWTSAIATVLDAMPRDG